MSAYSVPWSALSGSVIPVYTGFFNGFQEDSKGSSDTRSSFFSRTTQFGIPAFNQKNSSECPALQNSNRPV
jgi:hypothetical protein